MGRSFGRRVLDLLWGPDGDAELYDDGDAPMDEEEYGFPMDEEPPTRPAPPPRRWGLGKQEEVVELRPQRHPRTEVCYPHSFQDAQRLADLFKQGAQLIIDLEEVDVQQRDGLVKFLCGVVYGLDGSTRKINELTFVFAPRQHELKGDKRREPGEPANGVPRFSMPQ